MEVVRDKYFYQGVVDFVDYGGVLSRLPCTYWLQETLERGPNLGNTWFIENDGFGWYVSSSTDESNPLGMFHSKRTLDDSRWLPANWEFI